MISKKSRLYSIVYEKCPRCHQGEIFKNRNPYKGLTFKMMYNNCSICGQAYEPEPGFFQGAMYVSYAVSVAICFIIGGVLLFTNLTAEVILIILFALLIILLPVIFRVSRLIWLNLFIGYNPNLNHGHK